MAEDEHAEVEVVAAGQACGAGLADGVALFDLLAFLDVDLAQVGIEGLQAQAVVDDDGLAVDAEKSGERHLAAVGGRDRGAFQGSQVHAHEKLFTIKAQGQLTSASAYNRQIIAYRSGKPVRLRDVGQTIDSTLNNKNAGFFDQDQGIVIAVKRGAGTNTIQLVQAIRNMTAVRVG